MGCRDRLAVRPRQHSDVRHRRRQIAHAVHNGYTPFIETDVPVNPDNPGGQLFNLKGEVISINSMTYSRTGGVQGLSFAIPIDEAIRDKDQIVKTDPRIAGNEGGDGFITRFFRSSLEDETLHKFYRLRAQVDEDASHFVTVERAELRALLIDHAFVCGFALGMPPIVEEPREQA
jgi:hypothetical protein